MRNYLLAAALLLSASAHALTADAARAIAVGEGDARIEALHAAVAKPDEKTVAFIQALSEDAVKLVAGKPVIVVGDKGQDPVSGVSVALPDTAEDVMNNNRMHGELDNALAALKLLSPDEAVRRANLYGDPLPARNHRIVHGDRAQSYGLMNGLRFVAYVFDEPNHAVSGFMRRVFLIPLIHRFPTKQPLADIPVMLGLR